MIGGTKLDLRNMNSIHKRLSLLFVLLYLHMKSVKADLILKPRDTEVVIGDSTYFDCASNVDTNEVNWYHYAVGAKHHEDTCLYCVGRVHPHYENRIAVDRNFSTGNYRLRIKTVKRQDAGRYICQDNGGTGKSISAQLVVLESTPECLSSMKSDGFVGPNSCYLPLDKLQLSCSVSYNGNTHPILQWKMAGNDVPILEGIATDYSGKQAMVNLTMSSSIEMNGEFFTCGTTRSQDKQLSCSTDSAKIKYAVGQHTILNIAKSETITCSANASVPCTFRWLYDNDTQNPVSYNQVLTTNRLGNHSCEASCPINGFSCTFVAMRIIVIEEKPSKTSLISNKLIPTIIVILLIIAYFMIFRKLKDRHANSASQFETVALRKNKAFIKVAEITTKVSRRWDRAIAGVAALEDLHVLYVVSAKSSKVEVFDITTYKFMHRRHLGGLENPMDLTSCKLNNCLYIMDLKSPYTPKYVIRVDSNVKTLCQWSIRDEYGNLSVTNEGNVIVTYCDKSKLVKYSPDGTRLNFVSLSVDLIYPTHALELRNGQFLICYGIDEDKTHRVCILNEKGEIIKNSSQTMETPNYLAVDDAGLVFVADQGNNRVIVLNTDLELIGEIGSEQNGLRSPKGICVNGKFTGKLFVVDNGVRSESMRRIRKLLIFTYDLPSQ